MEENIFDEKNSIYPQDNVFNYEKVKTSDESKCKQHNINANGKHYTGDDCGCDGIVVESVPIDNGLWWLFAIGLLLILKLK